MLKIFPLVLANRRSASVPTADAVSAVLNANGKSPLSAAVLKRSAAAVPPSPPPSNSVLSAMFDAAIWAGFIVPSAYWTALKSVTPSGIGNTTDPNISLSANAFLFPTKGLTPSCKFILELFLLVCMNAVTGVPKLLVNISPAAFISISPPPPISAGSNFITVILSLSCKKSVMPVGNSKSVLYFFLAFISAPPPFNTSSTLELTSSSSLNASDSS